MTTITPATQGAAAASQAPPPPAKSASLLSSDFETFLKMLTAQAQNQDPLEPMDSTEYAAQLAQFSMVEQQVKSNDLLSALTAELSTSNMARMSNWIGMEALSTAPVGFDGSPITLIPDPAAVADDVQLVVRDSAGNEIQRLQLPLSSEPVEWAGVAGNGAPLPPGLYFFEVESRAQGALVKTAAAQSYGRITEARNVDGDTLLVLAGGGTVRAADVAGLRGPSGSN